MTYPSYQSPPGYPQGPGQYSYVPRNGMGTTALVMGLISFPLGLVPVILVWASIPLGVLAVIFGVIGVVRAVRAEATNKGSAIAGIVLGVLGVVASLFWILTAVLAVFHQTANRTQSLPRQTLPTFTYSLPPTTTTTPPKAHHVVYRVTGTATKALITYSTDGTPTLAQDADASVPWTHEIDTPAGQILSIPLVSAQNEGPGTITCTLEVDGKVAKTVTSNGEASTADCTVTLEH